MDLNLLTAERVYDLVTAAASDSQTAYIRCLVIPTKRHPLVTLTVYNVDDTPYLQYIFEVDYYSHLYDLVAEYDFYNKRHLAGFIAKLSTFQDVPSPVKSYPVAQAA
jgi:hypothetical protein